MGEILVLSSRFLLLVGLGVLQLRQDLSRVSARVVVICVLSCFSLRSLLARVSAEHVLVMLKFVLLDELFGVLWWFGAHDWNFLDEIRDFSGNENKGNFVEKRSMVGNARKTYLLSN